MAKLREWMSQLERLAPRQLAESWDNVGLLIGDPEAEVHSALTCLTLTSDVAEEALQGGHRLVITHHPVLFRAVKRLTTETPEGAMLLKLIAGQVAVYSPHTGYDSAADGINAQLARKLGLSKIGVLRPASIEFAATGESPPVGGGRHGELAQPTTLSGFVASVKSALGVSQLQVTGAPAATVRKVAIACGSAAEFLTDAHRLGCDLLLTGEGRFHASLEARALGIGLVLAGHYATERFAMESLAEKLHTAIPGARILASRAERDPLEWM